MSKKNFKNADLIDNLSHSCYYIRIFGTQDIKIESNERFLFDTPNGDVEIILDKSEDGKVVGIEILDD